jgi:hypothetical protein
VVMTFPAEGISFNLFFLEVGWCHSIVFLCEVQSDGPCSSTVMIHDSKLSPSAMLQESTSEHSAHCMIVSQAS